MGIRNDAGTRERGVTGFDVSGAAYCFANLFGCISSFQLAYRHLPRNFQTHRLSRVDAIPTGIRDRCCSALSTQQLPDLLNIAHCIVACQTP